MNRKWAYRRLGNRQYLLLNNDRTKLALIEPYEEDGSLQVQTETGWRTVKGERWRYCPVNPQCLEYQGEVVANVDTAPLLDPVEWDERPFRSSDDWGGPFDSMTEAMDLWAIHP